VARQHAVARPTRSARRQHEKERVAADSERRAEPGKKSAVEAPALRTPAFDSSGSVITRTGTDPLSNRFAEVAEAFSVVARRSSRHELGAVLYFDTPSISDVGPVPITRRGLLTLRAGRREPPDGAGSSELAPSLHRAVEIAEAHLDHKVTLVVLSDFLLVLPVPRYTGTGTAHLGDDDQGAREQETASKKKSQAIALGQPHALTHPST
jgi:hypothetical protein